MDSVKWRMVDVCVLLGNFLHVKQEDRRCSEARNLIFPIIVSMDSSCSGLSSRGLPINTHVLMSLLLCLFPIEVRFCCCLQYASISVCFFSPIKAYVSLQLFSVAIKRMLISKHLSKICPKCKKWTWMDVLSIKSKVVIYKNTCLAIEKITKKYQ